MTNTIKISQEGRVVLVQINRPDALNALNAEVLHEMVEVLSPLDKDPDVGCFVITGSEKAFAAGADIKDMVDEAEIEEAGFGKGSSDGTEGFGDMLYKGMDEMYKKHGKDMVDEILEMYKKSETK